MKRKNGNKVKIKKSLSQDTHSFGDIFSITYNDITQHYILAQLNGTNTDGNAFNFVSISTGNRFGSDFHTISGLIESVKRTSGCTIEKIFSVGKCSIVIKDR